MLRARSRLHEAVELDSRKDGSDEASFEEVGSQGANRRPQLKDVQLTQALRLAPDGRKEQVRHNLQVSTKDEFVPTRPRVSSPALLRRFC